MASPSKSFVWRLLVPLSVPFLKLYYTFVNTYPFSVGIGNPIDKDSTPLVWGLLGFPVKRKASAHPSKPAHKELLEGSQLPKTYSASRGSEEVSIECHANESSPAAARNKEFELRCEKLKKGLASAEEKCMFVETLANQDFEIEVLKANLDEILSKRDVYHKDSYHLFMEAKSLLRENVLQAKLIEGLLRRQSELEEELCLSSSRPSCDAEASLFQLPPMSPQVEVHHLKEKVNSLIGKHRIHKSRLSRERARDT
ncbi:hypothetical protein HAX54_037327 [Datura stramonium]|uniref:Uncharacterized protein n=1 Tax=Datura stramonium TaxID=4076 RepID=A0ABS8RJA6_DATST|nr:hypothetical protein [Datura stramonium]